MVFFSMSVKLFDGIIGRNKEFCRKYKNIYI